MRVGLRKVLKDWRLTFFSSAPRMRVHGSMTVVLVGTKDIRFLQQALWPTWMMIEERKEAAARLHAVEFGFASLAPLPESRQATGNLLADARSIQSWG